MPVELYHGSSEIIEYPQIRKTKYTKDFSWGFYCTKSYEQAKRWAAFHQSELLEDWELAAAKQELFPIAPLH